jgi:uncharacterized lipoprotein YddW (UPF0748 family)
MKSTLNVYCYVSLFFLLSCAVNAQVPPKREFRAAWIATVVNLDWPTTKGADPNTQRSQLTSILDGLKSAGINAVVFQIRTECDAFYPSTIEPWSYWLTGQQGKAPASPFDPLQFALDEAHKRGMELHAWFNPYRAERIAGNYALDPRHVTVQHPDWVIQMGTYRFLNPGMKAVRDYVAGVISDVVRRYDIDGAHMDDYFYQDGIAKEDTATFRLESRGFTNIGDWRRDNVNSLLRQIFDSIQAIKANVKWGISPRGIWKNGVPSGITGSDNYSVIFCDAVAWLQGKYIDYITPQLYWPLGGNQDYAKLMPWWSSQRNGRHLYVGHGSYRIVDGSNWGASEIPNQIRLNRTNSYAQGSIFFRSKLGLLDNPKGLVDSLNNDLYKYPALRPIMSWKDTLPPNSPASLAVTRQTASASITWSAPATAADGGVAEQYVVYRSTSLPIVTDDPRNIVSIQTSASYTENSFPPPAVTYYYGVTALDHLQNESRLSNIMGLTASGVAGVEEAPSIPLGFVLYQNYPNPFNPVTVISFHLPAAQNVTLSVYDMLGREVRVLIHGMLGAGNHHAQFDGSGLASGIYIYRIAAGERTESRKMQLIK